MSPAPILEDQMLLGIPVEVAARVVDMFRKQVPDSLQKIGKYRDQFEDGPLAEEAHRLKGSCLALGASRMAEILKYMQACSRENDWDRVDHLLQQIRLDYEKTDQALTELMARLTG